MSALGRLWKWTLAAVVALTAVACGTQQMDEPDRAGSPVLPSAAGEPGTLLGDGFEVAAGTTLIGDPIPLGIVIEPDGATVVDGGWVATSIVDVGGEPLEIIDHYLRQAERRGLVEQPTTGCLPDYPHDGLVVCAGFARNDEGSDPRSLSVQFVRGRRAGIVSNHVVLRFSTAELYRTYGQMFTEWAFESTFGDGPRSVTIPEPTAWPPLPTVGDELPENGETMHRLTVQPESRIAGPLRLNLNDASGGFAAIFEVTGDPQEVFAAYLDHLAELGPTGPEPTTSTSGEATTTHAHVDQAGGDSFLLTLVERPGRPTWLAIEAGHD